MIFVPNKKRAKKERRRTNSLVVQRVRGEKRQLFVIIKDAKELKAYCNMFWKLLQMTTTLIFEGDGRHISSFFFLSVKAEIGFVLAVWKENEDSWSFLVEHTEN